MRQQHLKQSSQSSAPPGGCGSRDGEGRRGKGQARAGRKPAGYPGRKNRPSQPGSPGYFPGQGSSPSPHRASKSPPKPGLCPRGAGREHAGGDHRHTLAVTKPLMAKSAELQPWLQRIRLVLRALIEIREPRSLAGGCRG